MGGPDPGRENRMTFKKRTRTLIKKAHELATFSGADVYFVIHHPRATLAYNSVQEERRHWPPADELLVFLFSFSFGLKPMSPSWQAQERHHPRLQRIAPSTMDPPPMDTDEEEFRKFCQYFAHRAEMLQSLDEELQGCSWQPGDNMDREQVWVKLCMLQKGLVLCGYWEVENMT